MADVTLVLTRSVDPSSVVVRNAKPVVDVVGLVAADLSNGDEGS